MTSLPKNAYAAMAAIAATITGLDFFAVKATTAFVGLGLMVVNAGQTNANGDVAHALTEYGFNAFTAGADVDLDTITGDKTAPSLKPYPIPGVSTLKGLNGVSYGRRFAPLPSPQKGKSSVQYPTDTLLPPTWNAADKRWEFDSIFLTIDGVADTSKDKMKTLEGVAGASTKRHKEDDGRKFTYRVFDDGADWNKPGVAGVAVYRCDNKESNSPPPVA